MSGSRRRRTQLGTAVLAAAALLLTACGTNVSEERLAAASGGTALNGSQGAPAGETVVGGGDVGGTAGGVAPEAASGDVAAPGAVEGGTTGGTSGGSSSGTTGDTSGSAAGSTAGGTSGGTAAGSSGSAGSSTGGSSGGSTGGAAAQKPAAGTAASASGACTKTLSPVKLGQVGTFSGLIGQSVGGMKPGLAVWAQDINARGGLQCHPVQLTQIDDQNDPQKTEAAVSSLKEKGVQAIVGANVPLTISGLRDGVRKTKLPAVGGDGIDVAWADDPMLFPQGGTPLSAFGGGLAAVKKDKGFTKVALMYCAEAAICTLTNSSAKAKGGIMDLAGVKMVNSEQVTLVQSDYTSACQNAKNAGAEFIMVLVDAAAMRRVASSCASVNFSVPIAGTAIDFTAESPNDKNLSKVGVYASAPVAPFVATDSPALKAFQAAYEKYLPGVKADESAIEGWSAGILLEEALEKVSAKARSGDITTPLILEGLYSLKNATARDLGPGVTFVKGGKPKMNPCYYVLTIKDGSYRAPFGGEKFCFSRDPARK